MRIIGIIPARYGSTRLEGKPLADISGKPMIQHVYERALKAIPNVLVATDDRRIAEAVTAFGGNCVLTGLHNTGSNRCLEAYEIFTKTNDSAYDVIVNIQGDEPLLNPDQLLELTSCFEDGSTQMATLAHSVAADKADEGVFVVLKQNGNALYFSRNKIPFNRNEVQSYLKHVGLYAYTPEALKLFANLKQTPAELSESLEQLRWLENGYELKVSLTKHETIAVDTPEDLEKVRAIMCR